ncbi:hypothetical protein BBP40_010655 [Aspergillus hancockii]|nr:hypothetical protein BBP40_010655 [Aspergillus hancockii]
MPFGRSPLWASGSIQRRSFDFTVVFEKSISSVLPSSLSILSAALRMIVLDKAKPKVSTGFRQPFKLCLDVVFDLLQLSILVLDVLPTDDSHQPLSIASLALSVADAVFICTLSYFEHERSISPSSLLLVYLSFRRINGKTQHFLNSDDKNRSPEETGGIFSNVLFLWEHLLLLTGFKKVLSLGDLYHLPQSCMVDELDHRFQTTLDKS